MTVVHTYSGLDLDLVNPRAEDINLRDVAHHLALQARFNGATGTPISVAQHSVYVARVAAHLGGNPLTQFAALLHDAHEAYLGDITRPVRRVLDADVALAQLQRRLDEAIEEAFGLAGRVTAAMRSMIGGADNMALAAEWRDHMRGPCPVQVFAAAPFPVKALPWHKAEEDFLKAFVQLQVLSGCASTPTPTDILK